MKLREIVTMVSRLDPNAPAVWFRERWWSWRDVVAIGDEVLQRADSSGVTGDQTIGLVLRNHPATLAVALAAMRAGRSILTFSPLLPDAALAADVADNRPAVLVAISPDWERAGLVEAVAESGCLGVQLDPGDGHVSGVAETAYLPTATHATTHRSTAAMMLTSGTTGPSKRLAVTVRSLEEAIDAATLHHEGKPADAPPSLRESTSIIDLPMFNISAYLDLATIVAAGRRICLLERFEPDAWVDAVERHRVAVALLVPAAMKMVYERDYEAERLRSLKVVRSGSAPVDPVLAEAFEARYGIPVIVAYGATEFAGALTSLTMKDRRKWGSAKRGSVGRAHPGVELRIVDPNDGRDLGAGEVGLLEARARQIATRQWVRTNDLARLDDDGFLYIEGRADDVIIRGGFKISPTDVVAVLCEHPDVIDAAVIGLPDDRLGQVPAAAVVLAPNARADGDALTAELENLVRTRLAPYAVPVVLRVGGGASPHADPEGREGRAGATLGPTMNVAAGPLDR